jgi:hypothetical protein
MTSPGTNPLLNFRAPDYVVQWLDDLRRIEKDIPNRGEMVRRLIERAAREAGVIDPPMPKKRPRKED